MIFKLDQDLHIHSFLSACCADDYMTVETITNFAVIHGYREICITDHVWSTSVDGAPDWYRPQDIEHISLSKPLPEPPELKVFFGCEVEYLGGDKLSITRSEFDTFDFVVIPVNHMHMDGLVRPEGVDGVRNIAALVLRRLHELLTLDLPWENIGIAHLSGDCMYYEGSIADVLDAMDRSKLESVFFGLARKGAGIELNAGAFKEWDCRRDVFFKFYDMAMRAGCKFYLASDAHFAENLGGINKHLRKIIDYLGLSEEQKYSIINRKC